MMVPVMYVRVMLVTMSDWIVMMRMGMRFPGGIVGTMCVLMVLIMNMHMLVVECFMCMPMRMTLREVKPQACSHEKPRCHQRNRDWFSP